MLTPKVQTDIIRNPECIPVAVENVIRIVEIELAHWIGYRASCLIGEIQGSAVASCKFVIGNQADVVRPVVIRGKKFPVVDPLLWKLAVKADQRPGIGISQPAVEFALGFLKEEFDPIGSAIALDHLGFYGVVQQNLGSRFKVEHVLGPLVKTFHSSPQKHPPPNS